MKNISLVKKCYGCGVCVVACPLKIIDIRENAKGFYQAYVVDTKKCVECGVCTGICAALDERIPEENIVESSFAAYSKTERVRQECSSGGVGFELGKKGLELGWTVMGVRYDIRSGIAKHFATNDLGEWGASIGSKYIQSFTVDALRAIDRESCYMIFATPCTIDSLRRHIRRLKQEDRFLLVDFYCHGVPSMLLWRKYLQLMVPAGTELDRVAWRAKEFGWHDSWNMILEGKGFAQHSRWSRGDLFYRHFLGNTCLNDPCYACKYKCARSAADLRLGDLWGPEYADDEAGTSALVAFTHRGAEFLEQIDTVEMKSKPLAVVQQGQMVCSPHKGFANKLKFILLRSSLNLRQITRIEKIASKVISRLSKMKFKS